MDFYNMKISAPCRSVAMLIRHMGLQVNEQEMNLFAGDQFKPEFLKVCIFDITWFATGT